MAVTGPSLTAYGRAIRSSFGLLGAGENALTFALGYTFQRCPELLWAFLNDVGVAVRRAHLPAAQITLQRTSATAERDITDIEVVIPGRVHVIIEAKIGLAVPGIGQCQKYLTRFGPGEPRHRLVALVEAGSSDLTSSYGRSAAALGQVLMPYQWFRLVLHCVQLQKRYAAATEEGRWLRALRTFLEEEYGMRGFTEEVWIVPASTHAIWPGGCSLLDTHLRGRIYHHPSGSRYDARRPLYIACRHGNNVRAVQRVLGVVHDVLPTDYMPELAAATVFWPREPHTVWRLDAPVDLPRPLPTGDPTMWARHVSCDFDLLLSSASVYEAVQAMKRRGQSAAPA